MTTFIASIAHYVGGSGPFFPFLLFPFWILLVVGIVWFVRRRSAGRSGESVLAERYARGEITEDEYRTRRTFLREQSR